MTKQRMYAVAVFFIVCLTSALFGWLSGYNFDYRSSVVAVWALATSWFALLAAFIAHVETGE